MDHRIGMFRNGTAWCSEKDLERLRREAELGDDPEAKDRLERAQARCGQRSSIKSIEVRGRRWFQRSYGNTYHTSKIWVTFAGGEQRELIVPMQYGYGDHYLDTALDAAIAAGLVPEQVRHSHGGRDDLRTYCRKNKIEFSYGVEDVRRQKDLHLGGRRR